VISNNGNNTVTRVVNMAHPSANNAQTNSANVCDVANVRVHASDAVNNEANSQANTVNTADTRNNKDRRRRERRERRARRQQRHSQLINQMDAYMYEGGVMGYPHPEHLPDLLNSHVPPPAYTTLPGHGQARVYPPSPQGPVRIPPPHPAPRGWRESFPGFSRRSRNTGGVMGGTYLPEREEGKSCCGVTMSQTVSIRWFIVMIAFVGICCAVVGTVLGAMKASGREHLTVSLLMIGVGIVLITVSGIAWRLTSHDAPSCRAMLGLSGYQECGDGRFMPRPPGFPRPSHPYAGMMYSEFQYRPPPPSYQASMQEYRLRLLLLDRGAPPPGPPPPQVVSPPPAYRGLMRNGMTVPSDLLSRPPSYRSRASDAPVPVHGRHPSQLSYLSFDGNPTHSVVVEQAVVEDQAVDKNHASVVPVSGPPDNKSSIKIETGELDSYMANWTQDQMDRIETISCKTDSHGRGRRGRGRNKDMVTIVQNNGNGTVVTQSPGHHVPVIVTVSGGLDQLEQGQQETETPEIEILAHL